jgi:hypothetical protein
MSDVNAHKRMGSAWPVTESAMLLTWHSSTDSWASSPTPTDNMPLSVDGHTYRVQETASKAGVKTRFTAHGIRRGAARDAARLDKRLKPGGRALYTPNSTKRKAQEIKCLLDR